jgi:Rab proteins geranylgeranyltransferase component A
LLQITLNPLDTVPYRSATLSRLPTSTLSNPSRLQASRAYSLDLSPHLLYCSSDLVSCLANTKLSQYLEFKALEHIFIFQEGNQSEITLHKVPSSREDIFTSDLSLPEKRKLMKFLNYVLNTESTGMSLSYISWHKDDLVESFDNLLSSPEYNLSLQLRNVIQYAIAQSPTQEISISKAIHAIRRHVLGVGLYGSFPIIVPLHGGGGELSQAFCRAAAVKGTTYILGREIQQISTNPQDEYPITVQFNVSETEELPTVRCKKVVRLACPPVSDSVKITRRITVVEGIFEALFVSESSCPDAALIVIPPEILRKEQTLPVQIIIHGGDIGECPPGQCISMVNSL